MSNKKRELDAVIATAITESDVSSIDDVVVGALIADVRSMMAGDPPPARGELQTLLTGGFDATTVAAQPSAFVVPVPSSVLTASRRPKMLKVALAKIAGLTLAAKIGLAGAAVAATTTGAGAAGVLPPPAQEAFDRIGVFATSDDEEAEVQVEPGEEDSTTAVSEVVEDTKTSGEADSEREPGPVNDAVREVIEGTEPQDRDREFGQEVADTASQNRQDTVVRNGDDAGDENDDAGVLQREQRAPVSPPVGPPASGQGPPQN